MGHQLNAQQLHLKGSSRSELDEQLPPRQQPTRWPDASSAPTAQTTVTAPQENAGQVEEKCVYRPCPAYGRIPNSADSSIGLKPYTHLRREWRSEHN